MAYSGGVDSSLLLRAAYVAHGDDALGLLAVTSMHPPAETARALENAEAMGVRVEKVSLDPLINDDIRRNPQDRCYFCKRLIYSAFLDRLASLGRPRNLMDGSNCDDLSDVRPGRRAIAELSVKTPLVAVGLDKKSVRLVAREQGLSVWDQPSSSCLATRIVTGFELTRSRLEKVARAEAALTSVGFAHTRLRLFHPENNFIGVELAKDDLERFISLDLRSKIKEALAGMGFGRIFIEIDGRFKP